MEYLADTVALIRFFSQSGQIGNKAKNIFNNTENGQNIIWMSVISIVEIMYLSERNKIPINLEEFLFKIGQSKNYKVIDLDLDIIKVANELKGLELHDRLIVASAKYLNIPIITSDKVIKESGILDVIWK